MLLGIIFLISACSSQKKWYNYRDKDVVFQQDLKNCQNNANNLATKQSLLGNALVLETYNSHLLQCLYSKGWTQLAQGSLGRLEQKFSNEVRLDREAMRISAFGEKIDLASGNFEFLDANSSVYGPGYFKEFNFKGPDNIYLNLVFQENILREFDKNSFPVDKSFIIFESGAEKSGSKHFNWSVYCGIVKGKWVAGMGSYVLLSPKQRITAVVTKKMIPKDRDPAFPLRLTRKQYSNLSEFEDKWLEWWFNQFN